MNNKIESIISIVQAAASQLTRNAGLDGRMDDGGSGQLDMQVRFYCYGMRGEIPSEWESYAKKTDPEWQEYQRLKAKFS